jgi:hypothetical protein
MTIVRNNSSNHNNNNINGVVHHIRPSIATTSPTGVSTVAAAVKSDPPSDASAIAEVLGIKMITTSAGDDHEEALPHGRLAPSIMETSSFQDFTEETRQVKKCRGYLSSDASLL